MSSTYPVTDIILGVVLSLLLSFSAGVIGFPGAKGEPGDKGVQGSLGLVGDSGFPGIKGNMSYLIAQLDWNMTANMCLRTPLLSYSNWFGFLKHINV